MNSLYFTIGGTILLALIVALVGPLFVDWTSYRAAFEREATNALGQPVHVLGAADMQILPLPHLHFESVHVGPKENAPILSVDEFDVRVELFPLVQGKIEVVDMTLRNPVLKLEIDEQGQFDWRQDGGRFWERDMEKIRLNDVRVENGRIDFKDKSTGRSKEIASLNGTLDARTLIGPYKIEAAFHMDGEPYSLMLSTGMASETGLRVKSLLTPANHAVLINMDGNVKEQEDGRYHYVGTSQLTNAIDGLEDATIPWSLSGESDLTVSSLSMPKFEFSHGPVDQAYRLDGRGEILFGSDPRFDIAVSSRQLDLDRALGNGPNAPIHLQDGIAHLADALTKMPLPAMPGKVRFDVPGVILGGGIIRSLELDAELEKSDWKINAFSASFPGQTDLTITSGLFSRQLVVSDLVHVFEGEARLQSAQPVAFAKWWLKDAPKNTRLKPFDLTGHLLLQSGHVKISDLDLLMDEDQATGQIDWFSGGGDAGSEGGALDIRLDAERADLDAVLGVGSLLLRNASGEAAPLEQIALNVHTKRLVSGDFEGKELSANFHLSKGEIEINQLTVEDFAGSNLSAQGLLRNLSGVPNGKIEGKVEAKQLQGLASFVGDLLPDSNIAHWFEVNHEVMSPADVSFTLNGNETDEGLQGKLSGLFGGGRIDFTGELKGTLADWKKGDLSLDLALDNPDGEKLLKLLGVGDGVMELPAMNASVALKGAMSDGADLEASLATADGQDSLDYQGKLLFDPIKGLGAEGQVTLDVDDFATYMLAAGLPLSNQGEGLPVSLSSRFLLDEGKVSFKSLKGDWEDQKVAGDLTYEETIASRELTGSLEVGDIDGIWLGETVLGVGTLTSDTQDWSDMPFASYLSGLEQERPTIVKLKVKAKSLELTAPTIFEDPSFELVWRDSGLSINGFDAILQGGKVAGSLQLETVDGEATLNSHLAILESDLRPFRLAA
ncbi:AsmA family protein [uncultured Cohaesibacter sp.]|uniref:AsmA family protein n=1 Tax=uncultured Cohaesibacter sp. TaxID=1002546 RepID=UPI00292F3542|nr:AsmA family protein [uncultured Cohaesibacter sp.]